MNLGKPKVPNNDFIGKWQIYSCREFVHDRWSIHHHDLRGRQKGSAI